jgi:hypothetical protein
MLIPRVSILPKPIAKMVITNQKMWDESEISKCEMEVCSVKPFRSVKIVRITPTNAKLVRRSGKLNPWRARRLSISTGIICRMIRGDTVKMRKEISIGIIVFVLNFKFHHLPISPFYL